KYIFEFDNDIYLNAKTIHVAGSFNNWLQAKEGKIVIDNNKEWEMQKDQTGKWQLSSYFEVGRYEYKFVIDGEKWEPSEINNNLTFNIEENSIESTEQDSLSASFISFQTLLTKAKIESQGNNEV